MFTKPNPEEYASFFHTYISKLPDAPILDILENGVTKLIGLVQNLTEEQALKAYAPGKWTVKELIGHMMDTERIMAYRSLCISRAEQQSLPGFDEELYTANANFNKQTLGNLLEQYQLLRQSNLLFFRNMDEAMLQRSGTANGGTITTRALVAIIAGHEMHHTQILEERYLPVL